MTSTRLPLIVAVCMTVLLMSCSTASSDKAAKRQVDSPDFPTQLKSSAPHDVDRKLQAELTTKKEFAEVQRLFEVLSWQQFIALNWPRNDAGEPRANISAKGTQEWEGWKESFEVFKSDGGKPLPWGQRELPDGISVNNQSNKLLYRTSKFAHLDGANIDDEIDQAFTAPIWDQNGQAVRYEILMNETEFDYVVDNQLYNIDGQIDFSNAGKVVNFPSASRDKVGAIELKLAWKIINIEEDLEDRFLLKEAWVYDEDGSFEQALVGLVGMHIALKTDSSPQWIWATFEHVDNLAVDPLEKHNGEPLKASFYDPDCEICPINVYPQLKGDYSGSSIKRNQIQRVVPINRATQALNNQVQGLLAEQASVLQYYQLIGTQWPTQPSVPAYPIEQHSASNPPVLPDAVTNKSGGMPTPVWLTNMVMETYFQGATNVGQGNNQFNVKIANEAAYHQIEGGAKYGKNSQRIFGTESCMGCHSSASIATDKRLVNGEYQAIYGAPLKADFSWLLQLKAKFKNN